MKRRVKRFDGEEGSQVFSAAQEKWLGGADRTDPYILARMRAAVPDEPKKAATTPSVVKDEVIDMRDNPKNVISDDTRQRAMEYVKNQQTKPAPVVKPAAPTTVTKVKDSPSYLGEKKFSEDRAIQVTKEKAEKEKTGVKDKTFEEKVEDIKKENVTKPYPKKQSFFEGLKDKYGGKKVAGAEPRMAKGGTVKRTSASKRGDGIATKGHTRGKYC